MDTKIPRSEYPRPQLVRKNWLCLNGEWNFETDNEKSGMTRQLYKTPDLKGKITVPFCPESRLSGVENTDFMPCVWYGRRLSIPENWTGKRILLHFGAVDYSATVFINGEEVTGHQGGYTPFYADITEKLNRKNDFVTLCVYDDVRSHKQPGGKQSISRNSNGCFYTRTTGIWQSVWMEAVNECWIRDISFTPDIDSGSVSVRIKLSGNFPGSSLSLRIFWEGKETGRQNIGNIRTDTLCFSVPLSEIHLWDVGQGNLYSVSVRVEKQSRVLDEAESYFGMRSVCLDGRKFIINGRPVFGRWVLDQGYYPDGIYTAPTDEDLENDIKCAMALGFNGARLHQKIFDPRYLYHADKLGFLCWGEHANWSLDVTDPGSILNFLPEWTEAVQRDYSHPSVIGWCPFNETWNTEAGKQCDGVIDTVYRITKALDPTRPVIDTSGNFHVQSDIFDVHDYEQDPKAFAEYYAHIPDGIIKDQIWRNPNIRDRQHYNGKDPVFVSEYGGIGWMPGSNSGWGYGNGPATEEEFISRYRDLTDILLDNEYIMGFCYTQLYDIEQEKNGLMTYDRHFKFPPEIIKKINSRKAAIEKD